MEVHFEEIAKGNFILCERGFQVFTSEESFAPIRAVPVEMRRILWSDEIVIGLFTGNKITGGYSIAVSQIKADPPLLKIFFDELSPRPGMMVTQAVAFPGLLIAVRRTDLSTGCQTAEFITAGEVVKEQNFVQ
jgi:hypothetical protein